MIVKKTMLLECRKCHRRLEEFECTERHTGQTMTNVARPLFSRETTSLVISRQSNLISILILINLHDNDEIIHALSNQRYI